MSDQVCYISEKPCEFYDEGCEAAHPCDCPLNKTEEDVEVILNTIGIKCVSRRR
jgi:hypothetical protein